MITGTIVGDRELVAKFEQMPNRLREELKAGIGRAALLVQVQSKEAKLSGQVLQVRTGRLRRSINVKTSETATAVSASVGTNVAYARVHEYGFQGTVSVREHLATSKLGNKFTVRGHNRNVNVPEKSFLRSALADMAPQIRVEFEQAIQRAMR